MSVMTNGSVSKILCEDLLTIQEARREIASVTGRRPDKCTLYRWCMKGCRGTKLEHVRLGDRILTSKQALTRFIAARSA